MAYSKYFAALVLCAFSIGVQAAQIRNSITGNLSLAENACVSPISIFLNPAKICNYSGGPANFVEASAALQAGPLDSGGFYTDTFSAPPFVLSTQTGVDDNGVPLNTYLVNNGSVPSDGKVLTPLSGLLTIDDGGDGFGDTNDTISGTIVLGPGARIASTGSSLAGAKSVVEQWTSVTHTLPATTVSSAVANGGGGFNYVLGEAGFPGPLCTGMGGNPAGVGDCFPSERGWDPNTTELDSPWNVVNGGNGFNYEIGVGGGPEILSYGIPDFNFLAPGPNVGGATTAVPNGLVCTDTGLDPAEAGDPADTLTDCQDSAIAWGAVGTVGAGTGKLNAGFDNLVLTISTDATGAITTAQAYYTMEYVIIGASDNSWVGGGLNFTGVLAPLCVAGPDPFTVIDDATAQTLDVLANDSCDGALVQVVDNGVDDFMPDKGATAATNVTDVTYTPAGGGAANSPETFTYTVEDNLANSDQGLVTITLLDDLIPVVNDLGVVVNQGASVDFNAAAAPNDPGNTETGVTNAPGVASATQVAPNPTEGVVTVAGTVLTYTPNFGATGIDTFGYTLTDTNGDTTAAAVVTVGILDSIPEGDLFIDITSGSQATTDSACVAPVPFFNGEDCSYNNSNPTGFAPPPPDPPDIAFWAGPTAAAHYYAPGDAPGVDNPPSAGDPGKTELPITGTIAIKYNGTPCTADDTIGGELILGAGTRAFDGGQGAVGEESWGDGDIRFPWPATTVDSAAGNVQGGCDYVIASAGFPIRIQEAGGAGRLYPVDLSAVIGSYVAPSPAGMASITEGNVGIEVTVTVGPSWLCVANAVGDACDEGTGLNDGGSHFKGTREILETLLVSISTNSDGDIISGEIFATNESKIFNVAPNPYNSWDGTRWEFVGECNNCNLAHDDNYEVAIGETDVILDIGANDSSVLFDPTVVTITVPTNQGGTVVINNSPGPIANITATYTPSGGPNIETFTYEVDDGLNPPDTAVVTIDVILGKQPVANDVTLTLDTIGVDPSSVTGQFNGLTDYGNDAGNNGVVTTDNLSAKGTDSTNGIDVTYRPNGTFFTGSDSFGYLITDDQNDTDFGLVTINIPDAAPTTPDEVANTEPNIFVDIPISVILGNGSAAQHNYSISNDATGGTCALNAGNNTVTYTPDVGFSGNDNCTYTVADGDGSTSNGTITITVEDTPTANDDNLDVGTANSNLDIT